MIPRSLAPPVLAVGLAALGILSACGESPTGGLGLPEAIAAKGGGGGAGDPTVDDVHPASAPQDVTLDVQVFGKNYDDGSDVDMLLQGKTTPKVKTNSTTFVSDTELIANITIAADAVVDLYDVRVTSSRGKKGIGIELFEVTRRVGGGGGSPPDATVEMQPTTAGGAVNALVTATPGGVQIERDNKSQLKLSRGTFAIEVRFSNTQTAGIAECLQFGDEPNGLSYAQLFDRLVGPEFDRGFTLEYDKQDPDVGSVLRISWGPSQDSEALNTVNLSIASPSGPSASFPPLDVDRVPDRDIGPGETQAFTFQGGRVQVSENGGLTLVCPNLDLVEVIYAR